jgi:hypothetical protein
VAVDPFKHEAFLYAGDNEFVAGLSAFIRDGLSAEEPTLVVVGARRIDLLREDLGDDSAGVLFADMAAVGRNPARIIPAWQTFVSRNAAPGVRLRGVGEPIFPERRPDELVEAHRHEALLNLAFLDTSSFWLVCPYDLDVLPDAVVEEARRNHPHVSGGGQSNENGLYLGLEALSAPFDAPLPPRPSEAAEIAFDSSTFDALPRLVADYATEAGLSVPRRIDLVVAVSEIARSGAEGALYLWRDGGRILCEIHGRDGLAGPLADRLLPAADAHLGFWVANQLCDLVQVRTHPGGTTARLHVPLT